MMNLFYHDSICAELSIIEVALSKLSYSDAKPAMAALAEVRGRVDLIFELSKATSNVWTENSYVLGENWEARSFGVNPDTGRPYTYVDEWEMRYELIRREIVRKLNLGYTIEMLSPPLENTSTG
jgi:hypothetical protein